MTYYLSRHAKLQLFTWNPEQKIYLGGGLFPEFLEKLRVTPQNCELLLYLHNK